MSPDPKFDAPTHRDRRACARAPADTSVGDRSIATTRAPRRAASTDSAPVPQPASSRRAPLQFERQPRQQRLRASRRGRRARWRGSARPARPTSAAPRHRPRCGRNRSRSSPRRSQIGGDSHQSNPSRSKMSRSFIGSRDQAARCRPTASRASRRYSSCTASSSGDRLHLEQRRLLQAAAADDVEVREMRHASSGRPCR